MSTEKQTSPPTMNEPAPPSYSPDHSTGEGSETISPLPPTYTQKGIPNSISSPSPAYASPASNNQLTPGVTTDFHSIYQFGYDGTPNDVNPNDPDMLAASQLFNAIDSGDQERVAQCLSVGDVTANAKFRDETPLLRAVNARNVQIVKQLLEAGANVDEFGVVSKEYDPSTYTYEPTLRTPLQQASSIGHLILVKLLIEQYHASDSLVAPDGQIPLRLAASNNHAEIVAYLPSRRNGGFKRWQFKNRKALRRVRKACKAIGTFIKFFVWDVEKFFLWTVPKHVIVKPTVKACKWCWERRREFGPWCVCQIKKMPGRISKAGKWVGKVPRGVWRFGTETLPRWIKEFSKWLWKVLTVKLPKALRILKEWIVSGITSVGKTLWNAVLKVISFFSTVIEAILSFFKALTLQDIWNGFIEVLRAVFITLPKMIVSWIKNFGDASWKIMKALFGTLGKALWILGYAVLWVITFLPKQLWRILESIGGSIAKAGHEVKIWVNPKSR